MMRMHLMFPENMFLKAPTTSEMLGQQVNAECWDVRIPKRSCLAVKDKLSCNKPISVMI